ncbi:MAG: class I adenylate-forming enzyme family protein [Microthrixaceae bacterium]
MNRNLASDFERRAQSDPTARGLLHEDGRTWTWAGLDAAAADVAEILRGAAPEGGRVAVHLANSPELVITMLGSWKAGMVPVAVSGLYNGDELAKCVAQVGPAVLVTDPANDPGGNHVLVEPERVTKVLVSHEGADHADHVVRPSPEPGAEDEGVVLFTGGTTGTPKPVSLAHVGTYQSMSNLVRAQKGRPGPLPTCPPELPPNLLALPLFHSGGLQSLLVALHLGRSVILLERFSVDRIAQLVPEHGVDNLFLLPTMIYDLARADETPDLTSVRRVLVAGQRLDPVLQAEFESRFGVMVLSNYGSTELGHVAGWTGPDLKAGRWKAGAVGRIYDGVEVEIRNEAGAVVSTGEVGELWVKSKRTKGYVAEGDTEAGDLMVDGWIRSGDMGRLDDDRTLYLVGRRRELIKTGGFQVWPAELEQVVRSVPAVDDAAVVGLPDARLGEVPAAAVVLRPGAGDVSVIGQEVMDLCREKLSHFKAVRAVYVLDELPRSEAGKVKRDEIEQQLAEQEPVAVRA